MQDAEAPNPARQHERIVKQIVTELPSYGE